MRITAAEKEATRQRILDVAEDLFQRQGFDVTTTRDIAQAAGIATGTLFNYFENKEAIVASLAEAAFHKAHADRKLERGELDEQLFALIAAELRRLRPLRKYLAPILDQAFNPLATRDRGADVRASHLELFIDVARQQGFDDLSPVAMQLYWTLYTGVLQFWTADKSPKQEDTLALLDQSLTMFVAWLRNAANC
jgi:AcrR family transcriptional regulator